MILPLVIIAVCLAVISFIVFYLLVGKIITQEKTIFEMNNRLNSSDEEYIHIFNLNMELVDRLESFEKKPKKSKVNNETWYNENDSRMNIIGQNGNEGTHYDTIKTTI
jgi:hypothetical protein